VKPNKKCCSSTPRCELCPIRMLAEGTLPPGYTVRRRRLVKLKGKARRAQNSRSSGLSNPLSAS